MVDPDVTPESVSASSHEETPSKSEDFSRSLLARVTGYHGKFEPTDANAPKFDGNNVTDFLEEYNFEADRVNWDGTQRKKMLPYFCTTKYKALTRKLPAYANQSVRWTDYQKALCKAYSGSDENRKRGTRAYMEKFIAEISRKQPMVKIDEYYLEFVTHYDHAESRGQVTALERGHYFFRGLAREDMSQVLSTMPKEDRPRLDDLTSFDAEKIYDFVRALHEVEEGLNDLTIDYTAVSQTLARRDAEKVVDQFPTMEELGGVPKPVGPGLVATPVIQKPPPLPAVDPAVNDLIRQFQGMTLSVEHFNYLANGPMPLRRLLAKPENWNEAYKHLVLMPQRKVAEVLERNDGSFKTPYPPTQNPRADVMIQNGREQQKPKCRCCGKEGHIIAACPDLALLKDNGWFHTRTEAHSGGWNQARYYFGPYPNDKWGVFPGGGFAPRAFGSEVLQWVLQSLKERFQVTDDQLKQTIKHVLPQWFDNYGKPKVVEAPAGSGESYTIEEGEGGSALAQQTMALRAAAMFLENVSPAGEVYNTEPGTFAVETRNKGIRKASEVGIRKENRSSGKKQAVPRMKSARMDEQIIPSIEDEGEILRHPPVVDIPDESMPDAQVDPLREALRRSFPTPTDSRSTTARADTQPAPVLRPARKQQPTTAPTSGDLAAIVKSTSIETIAMALLNQEVKGLRQVDMLQIPVIAEAVSKAIEEGRKPAVRFRDSGETNEVRDMPEAADLRAMFEWGSQAGSGEANNIETSVDHGEVITREVLQQLCPKLSRNQREQRVQAEEANEVGDFQDYEINDEEDGYVEEQEAVSSGLRLKSEDQHRQWTMKGQLPTCWVSVHGGMGRALIDTGSQLNVMRLSTARALNVYITEMDQSHLPKELQQGMISADGSMDPYVGTAFRVPIMVGGILIPTHFRIVRKLRRAILLGTPWCATAKLRIQFDTFGRTLCHIQSLNGRNEISFVGCDPPPTAAPMAIGQEKDK